MDLEIDGNERREMVKGNVLIILPDAHTHTTEQNKLEIDRRELPDLRRYFQNSIHCWMNLKHCKTKATTIENRIRPKRESYFNIKVILW